jgi:tRNA threonylcarbamoyl adenosine modification protein (Sua5/YciO/YrdC/YwlC family)
VAEIVSIDSAAPQPERIARAAELIRGGEVVAIPTDTVYGLAADPFNAAAVQKVFAAKGRPPDAPILLLVDSLQMAAGLAKRLPPLFDSLAGRFWPGPLTIVVDAHASIPPIVTAGTARVGIRLPAAPVVRALVSALGHPITGTSANISGEPECRSAQEVADAMGERIPLILDGGPALASTPSTVVGLSSDSWNIIREGEIRRTELEQFFGAS